MQFSDSEFDEMLDFLDIVINKHLMDHEKVVFFDLLRLMEYA